MKAQAVIFPTVCKITFLKSFLEQQQVSNFHAGYFASSTDFQFCAGSNQMPRESLFNCLLPNKDVMRRHGSLFPLYSFAAFGTLLKKKKTLVLLFLK